jgi:hypothetical protein
VGHDHDGCAMTQHLHRDDGVCLGVIWRYAQRPTYAWCRPAGSSDAVSVGVCMIDQAARAAVERALEGGGGSV